MKEPPGNRRFCYAKNLKAMLQGAGILPARNFLMQAGMAGGLKTLPYGGVSGNGCWCYGFFRMPMRMAPKYFFSFRKASRLGP